MGGHGTTLGGAIVDSGRFPWKKHARSLPDVQPSRTRRITTWSTPTISRRPPTSDAAAASTSGRPDRCCRRSARSCCCRASRRWRCGSTATWRTAGAWRNFCATIRGWSGSTTPDSRTTPVTRSRRSISAAGPVRCMTFGVTGGFEAGKKFYDALDADQAAGQSRRRQVAGLPSGVDHPSTDVAARTAQGRRDAGDDPAQRRHRTHRRHHRRPRSALAAMERQRGAADDRANAATLGRCAMRDSADPIRTVSTSGSSTTCPTRRSTRPSGSFARCSARGRRRPGRAPDALHAAGGPAHRLRAAPGEPLLRPRRSVGPPSTTASS